MKKVAIGFGVGLAVGVASAIIGLRLYANDPLVPQEIRVAIPNVTQIVGLALQGAAVIWLIVLILGFSIFIITWLINEMRRKKKG